jgi:hypothetical protein
MGKFRDLDEFLAPPPLELPIHGKVYTFPGEISARTWLKLQSIEALTEQNEQVLMAELCGDQLEVMLEDGVTDRQLKAVLGTLMAFYLYDREVALTAWEMQGKASAPKRAKPKTSAPSSRPRGGSPSGSKITQAKNGPAPRPGPMSSSAGR